MFISFTYQRLSNHFFTSRNTPNRQSADTEQFEFTLRSEVGSNRVLLCYCTQVEFLDTCTLLEFYFSDNFLLLLLFKYFCHLCLK